MRKKICVLIVASLTVISLVGCGGNNDSYDVTTTSAYDSSSYEDKDLSDNTYESTTSSSTSKDSSSTYSGSSSTTEKSIDHYCEADGCMNEGTKTLTGFSGKTEYYCQKHYDEIQNTISKMEEDVGNGSASTHKCEACSKEGTHELTGFSGQTEYYCTEHYNEIIDTINKMYEDSGN